MTFTPKAWTNGTLVDAAAMIDLETRLGAYSDVAPAVASSRRDLARMNAQGYYAETSPRVENTVSSALVSGTAFYVSVGLLANDIVSNFYTSVQTAGSTFSGIGMKFGLYSSASVLLAQTGDVSASFLSIGGKVSALSATYTVSVTDGYYIGMLCIATTGPAIFRGASAAANGGKFTGASMAAFGFQSGLTDLPTLASITSPTSGPFAYWVGIS